MSRDAFADRLLDLAYGELPRKEALEVEAHAASCEACRAELARIRETRRLMAALPEEPAPDEGERVLLAAAREAAERRVPRRRLPPWLWGATLVAASLVAVGAVSYRILAMRPGPLARPDREALLGSSPYGAAEEPPAPAKDAVAHRSAAPRPPASAAPRPPAAVGAAEAPPPAPDRKRPAEARSEPSRAFAAPPPPVADAAPPPLAEMRAPREGREAAAPSAPAGEAARPSPSPPREPAPVMEREGQEVRGGARAAAEAARAPEAGRSLALAFAAPLRAEVRTYPGCEGESTRRVETDARGRVATYVREGTIAGRRVRIVHAFRPDGGLASVTAQDLDAGGPVDARALGVAVPERAEEARSDAPPRCGR